MFNIGIEKYSECCFLGFSKMYVFKKIIQDARQSRKSTDIGF